MAEIAMVVYSSRMFDIGRNISRWAHAVERNFTLNAIQAAPVNKRMNKGLGSLPVGALQSSIYGTVTRVGPTHMETDINVNVPYATYVLKGTEPIITPQSGNFLYVPKNAGFGTREKQKSVTGQRANPFLDKAARATARRHSSLAGWKSLAFTSW